MMAPALDHGSRTAALTARVVEDPADLGPHLDAWDALAVARARPFCAPAWMLAWWHEGRSGDARLRTVLVFDAAGALVGVGPFFAQVRPLGVVELRLLGAGFSHRIGPLSAAGLEDAVAREIARALAATRPRPASVVLEGVDATDRWADRLAAAWPGRRRPRLRTDVRMEAPVIDLGGSFEAWLESRPRKFRKEARRTARRLEEEGVTTRFADDGEAVDALLRLHVARWRERGGSNVGDRAGRVIARAARDAAAPGRVEIVLLEGPDGPVAAELLVRAGEAVGFWGGGFDPAWSRHAPGTQALLAVLEASATAGATIADLGGGDHEYKLRLADDSHPIEWRTVFPPGIRQLAVRAWLAPKHARAHARTLARRHLPAPWIARLRGRPSGA